MDRSTPAAPVANDGRGAQTFDLRASQNRCLESCAPLCNGGNVNNNSEDTMNDWEIDALDLIEHTLQRDCYFMTGTLRGCVATRSTPPPERWFTARQRERRRVLALVNEPRRLRSSSNRPLDKHGAIASPAYAPAASSSFRRSADAVASLTATPRCTARTPSTQQSRRRKASTTPRRARRTCKQCGKPSDKCDGAKPQKGGSDNCSFKCGRCRVGPLLCRCPKPPASVMSLSAVSADTDKENALPCRSIRPLSTAQLARTSTVQTPVPSTDRGSHERGIPETLDLGQSKKKASFVTSHYSPIPSPGADESDDDEDDDSWVPAT